MPLVRMSSKGQIVLPREVREALGLQKGSLLQVTVMANAVLIRPARTDEAAAPSWRRWRGILRGEGVVQELLEEHRRELERDAKRGA
jgi:AbrB family looped-hinge helix DNA binding protein